MSFLVSCNFKSAVRIRYDWPLDPGSGLHVNTNKLSDVCRQNWIKIPWTWLFYIR